MYYVTYIFIFPFRNGTRGVFMKPVSVILSSKVIAGKMTLNTSKQQSSEPITLKFDYSLVGYAYLYQGWM